MTVLDRAAATGSELAARIVDGPGGYTGVGGDEEWAAEVRRLATQRGATLLAHNYQLPAIQDVADHVGDSLALSRIAAEAPRTPSCSAACISWPRRPRSSAPTRPC